ncbi:MAG: hypothetical protein L0H78_25915, partial [Humibacillus sp.]|nr:hypothetical protein [Humibacillus sp.]
LLSAPQAIERATGSAAAAAAAASCGAHAVLMRSTDFHREIRNRLASPSGTPRAAGLRCQRSLDGATVTHHIHSQTFRLVAANTWEVRTRTDRPWRVYREAGTWYLTEQPRPGRRPRAQLLGAGSTTAGLAAAADRIQQFTRPAARATA